MLSFWRKGENHDGRTAANFRSGLRSRAFVTYALQFHRAIRNRDPESAVANLGRLLQDDRDRAVTAISDLRGESLDLRALSLTEHHEAPAKVT